MKIDDNLYESKELVASTLRDDQAYFLNNTYCPLSGSVCHKDCICFVRPESYKPSRAKKWRIMPWGCSNPMLGEHIAK